MSEESSEDKRVPEGRRVKKRRVGSKSSRETLYLKRKQLLREMQEQDDSPIKVRDQIESLRRKEAGEDEDRWGDRAKRKKGSQWMLWAVLGLAVPVIVTGLLFVVQRTAPNRTESEGDAINLDFDSISTGTEELSEKWFYDNAGEAFNRAIEILEMMNKPDLSKEELATIVRDSGQVERVHRAKSTDSYPAFDLRNPMMMQREFNSVDGTGYMALMGDREDHRPFRAYFVKTADGLRLDSDATEAWSTFPVADLPGEELSSPAIVRAFVRKEPNFDNRADEKVLSWFQLLDPTKVDFVWAYANATGPVDEQLKEMLNYGRIIEERDLDGERVTLRISRPRGVAENEFVIDEVLSKEWVLPAAD